MKMLASNRIILVCLFLSFNCFASQNTPTPESSDATCEAQTMTLDQLKAQALSSGREVLRFEKERRQLLLEREDLIRNMLLTLVAHEVMLIAGPQGTAKSYTIAAVLNRIVDEKSNEPDLFEHSLNRESTLSDVIGPINARELEKSGKYMRLTEEGMLSARIAALDEFFRASPGMLAKFLRVFSHKNLITGRTKIDSHLKAIFLFTNGTIPDLRDMFAHDPVLGGLESLIPLFDRNFVFQYVQSTVKLESKRKIISGQLPPIESLGTVTFQQLQDLTNLMDKVVIPDEVSDLITAAFEAKDKAFLQKEDEDKRNARMASRGQHPEIALYSRNRPYSDRSLVKASKYLKAIVIFDWLEKNGERPLEATMNDLRSLYNVAGLVGPDEKYFDFLLGFTNAVGSGDRYQLSTSKFETATFRTIMNDLILKVQASIVAFAESTNIPEKLMTEGWPEEEWQAFLNLGVGDLRDRIFRQLERIIPQNLAVPSDTFRPTPDQIASVKIQNQLLKALARLDSANGNSGTQSANELMAHFRAELDRKKEAELLALKEKEKAEAAKKAQLAQEEATKRRLEQERLEAEKLNAAFSDRNNYEDISTISIDSKEFRTPLFSEDGTTVFVFSDKEEAMKSVSFAGSNAGHNVTFSTRGNNDSDVFSAQPFGSFLMPTKGTLLSIRGTFVHPFDIDTRESAPPFAIGTSKTGYFTSVSEDGAQLWVFDPARKRLKSFSIEVNRMGDLIESGLDIVIKGNNVPHDLFSNLRPASDGHNNDFTSINQTAESRNTRALFFVSESTNEAFFTTNAVKALYSIALTSSGTRDKGEVRLVKELVPQNDTTGYQPLYFDRTNKVLYAGRIEATDKTFRLLEVPLHHPDRTVIRTFDNSKGLIQAPLSGFGVLRSNHYALLGTGAVTVALNLQTKSIINAAGFMPVNAGSTTGYVNPVVLSQDTIALTHFAPSKPSAMKIIRLKLNLPL